MSNPSTQNSDLPQISKTEEFEYGAGPGYGNKRTSDPEVAHDNSEFRFGSHQDTAPYSGGHETYGSGTTGGVGFGNKTGGFTEKNDSTMGKLMEKAGHVMKNEGMVEKGRAKREEKGFNGEGTV